MIIIQRYILREHVGPFFSAMGTIVLIFLLNIVFRDLGKLLGKGISALTIIEFFFLNLAWILALAIPMAVLIATLMAFGRLSADSEIAALKASGFNLYRLILPVLMAAAVLTVATERFQNIVLPEFNHRVRLLTYDMHRKKPTLALEPYVIFDDIPKYAIMVQEVDPDGKTLHDIIIHDNSDPSFSKTILAERADVAFQGERMVLTLYHGEMHEVAVQKLENYRRLEFDRHRIIIEVPNMVMKRSESEHRGDREKSAAMMQTEVVENRRRISQRLDRMRQLAVQEMKQVFPVSFFPDQADSAFGEKIVHTGYSLAGEKHRVQRLIQQLESEKMVVRGYKRSVNSLTVEIQKKYSIPVACLVFVLIGAPLGIMARQGGVAVGSALSLAFFIIYWSFLIGGEQLADRMLMNPIVAMWLPNVVVGTFGLYLVIRTVREMTFIEWDRIAGIFRRLKKGKAA